MAKAPESRSSDLSSDPTDACASAHGLVKALAERRFALPAQQNGFPPCADLLLSLIDSRLTQDEIVQHFNEYFRFGRVPSVPVVDFAAKRPDLDPALLECTGGKWPPTGCVATPCVRLEGERGGGPIKRVMLGDLIWLFYFERMGVFRILGVILDDYAYRGRFPISADTDVASVVEAMIGQVEVGESSTVRMRHSAYGRSLAWGSEPGRQLGMELNLNVGFDRLFHRFIFNALAFYRDRRLAVAIKDTYSQARPSVATLTALADTVDVLKQSFQAFSYGRNQVITLQSIVWAIAGLSVLQKLTTTLGIPPQLARPHQFVPAAWDTLVSNRPLSTTESNRYTLHRECARDGRALLLDLEVLNHEDTSPGGEFERWLDVAENRVEGYRTAYRALTGVDLGASDSAQIEQRV